MSQEDVTNFERTLELGKEIASQLSDSDVLGRWMAHHISDLIIRAETAEEAHADDVRHEAASMILKLWEHRAALAARGRPMGTFEPVFAALARLSKPQQPWQFYGVFAAGSEPDGSDLVAVPMLEVALKLEDEIRDIVQRVVILAAAEASNKEAKWLELSEHLVEDDQRRALRWLRRLERALEAGLETPDMDLDSGSGTVGRASDLVAAVRRAEEELGKLRRGLEVQLGPEDDARSAAPEPRT